MILKGLNMNDNVAQHATEYRAFIKEAYIDPIRTVIVVDDEFPSIDGLIRQETKRLSPDQEDGNHQNLWKRNDIESVGKILEVCRKPDRHWLVDVHDAQMVSIEHEKAFAPHLHQSDLMILDYHLDGNDGDGTKAIELLRLLMKNDHFNLVIVYTQGYPQAGGDINRVIQEIILGLMSADPDLFLHENPSAKVLKALQEWEDDEPDIVKQLQEKVDIGAYLAIRQQKKYDFEIARTLPEFHSLTTLIETKPEDVELDSKLLLRWLISERQKTLKDKLNTSSEQWVDFQQANDENNWIRTERLFVTVVSKQFDPDQLPDKLIDALYEWRPHPHRLIMSRMRAELDERGVVAEEKILSNHYLEAGWLQSLLEEDSENRKLKIRKTIKNHWDSLGDVIRNNVEEYASSLAKHLNSQTEDEIVKKFRLVDPAVNHTEIMKHINAFNCSKSIEGYHLTTGHILRTKNGGGKEYWLCLTPACDLVPEQKNDRGWKKHLGENIPFKAVRLFPSDACEALDHATMNNHIFLNIDDSISAFSFTPSGNPTSNPVWEQMFSKNHGMFSAPDFEISVNRVAIQEGALQVHESSFCIVSQLRYEYALNLLQRLGNTLSRVGLDFQKR